MCSSDLKISYDATLHFFDDLLRLLHPFMPFITEELWQTLYKREEGDSLMISPQPSAGVTNKTILSNFESAKNIIAGVCTIRLDKNIPNKEELELEFIGEHNVSVNSVISKMCNLTSIKQISKKQSESAGFLVATTEYSIPLSQNIDAETELQKLEAELIYTEGFLKSVIKKLSNEKLVQNAKPEIVENERKKQADAEVKITLLKENIASILKK